MRVSQRGKTDLYTVWVGWGGKGRGCFTGGKELEARHGVSLQALLTLPPVTRPSTGKAGRGSTAAGRSLQAFRVQQRARVRVGWGGVGAGWGHREDCVAGHMCFPNRQTERRL